MNGKRMLSLVLLVTATAALGGCYERVVGAKGMGAQGVTVNQPNAPADGVTKTRTQKRSLRLDDTVSR